MSDIFDALESQQDRLDRILQGLDEDQWNAPSACPGWTVRDVVLHLAQTEEGVAATLEGSLPPFPVTEGATTIDEVVENWVSSQRGAASGEVHDRWNAARRKALEGLKSADPEQPVAWAAAPLKPRTLATTRLSEHWIHTLDITDPLGIDDPDGDDLKNIAWLAFKTLGYAYSREGRGEPPTVRLELDAPDGEKWVFGAEDAEVVIAGPAGEFCRIAARRLSPDKAEKLTATGDRAGEVLELVRTYA